MLKVFNLVALQREEHPDGVDERQKGDGPKPGHELFGEPLTPKRCNEAISGDDGCHQGNAQENQHAARHLGPYIISVLPS